MRLSRISFVVVSIALLASACGSDASNVDAGASDGNDRSDTSDAPGEPDTSDVGGIRPSLAGRWILSELKIDGVVVSLPVGEGLEMTIANGEIGGSGGCNSFGGAFDTSDDGTLLLRELFWTEMACVEVERMDFESAYLGQLTNVNRWEADAGGITLLNDSASIRYTPGAAPTDAALEDTVWSFDSIFAGEGVNRVVSSTDLSAPPVTLVIADGSATLSTDGCDDIIFDFNHEGGTEGSIAFPAPAQLTASSCTSQNMVDAVAGLEASTSFMISESRLTFVGLPGETIGFIAS